MVFSVPLAKLQSENQQFSVSSFVAKQSSRKKKSENELSRDWDDHTET